MFKFTSQNSEKIHDEYMGNKKTGVRTNFHTHTCFCDGVDTPRAIVLEAIKKGFTTIGFSGHSYTPFDNKYCMNKRTEKEYIKCINKLKKEFSNDINIYCGIEQDFYSEEDYSCFDYRIGSVHYIYKDGIYIPVDKSPEDFKKNVKNFYGGDIYAFILDYYETVSNVVLKTNCEIIGHFDLITKFNENDRLFDTSNPVYIKAWEKALEKLIPENRIFEINTGAISRGYRKTPYPSYEILKKIKLMGGKVTVSSDSHEKNTIDFYFDKIFKLLKVIGFEEYYILNEKGVEAVPIKK